MPSGHKAPEEARLETFGPAAIRGLAAWAELRKWWLAHEAGANTPNWDLAVACEIESKPGLILVEAKAHESELSIARKPTNADASAESRANHERIGTAIGEACDALGKLVSGVAITRDSHYQLANRVAFAWKLAQLGIPTVLVYLGFLGDKNVGKEFRDDTHWKTVFGDYSRPALPPDAFERPLNCGMAPVWFLVRSRAVR
jgi:hypothetical protein